MVEVNKGIINTGTIGGDAKVSEVHVHASNASVNLKSRLDRVSQSPSRRTTAGTTPQKQLEELFQELRAVLATVPGSHRDGADAVVRQAQVLTTAASAAHPSKTFIQVSGEALKATLKFVADVAPPVAKIVTAIVSVAESIVGL